MAVPHCHLCRCMLTDDVTEEDRKRGAAYTCPECGALFTVGGKPVGEEAPHALPAATAPAAKRPRRRRPYYDWGQYFPS